MPTIYKRIKHYCNSTKNRILSQEQRIELGKIIADHYVNHSGIKKNLYRTSSLEPEGEFKVVSYPKIYNPEIDRQIAEYYLQNAPKKRKRIPLKQIKYIK